nr:hypothetical protein HmN_000477300 [Hymenolepis microstoma]
MFLPKPSMEPEVIESANVNSPVVTLRHIVTANKRVFSHFVSFLTLQQRSHFSGKYQSGEIVTEVSEYIQA